jgi:uncharacterized protein DUF4430
MAPNIVTVQVVNGPTIKVPWTAGMNAQQALERAYDVTSSPSEFTYALQYYGKQLGYLVLMMNETYESFMSSAHPFYFWESLVNGTPSTTGIDGTVLNDGDTITFELRAYNPAVHSGSTLKTKYESRLRVKR